MSAVTVAHQSMKMSADAASAAPTEHKLLDDYVGQLADKAREFARLGPRNKAALLRECVGRIRDIGPSWAAQGARARGAERAEEWLAGVTPTVRFFRLLAESLDEVAVHRRPRLGHGTRILPGGRLAIDLFPASLLDRISFAGFTGYALMQADVDRAAARRRQASFYQQRDPEGGVSLILGAGNVASIPPMDVASKMFVEGYCCLLKVNPANEWIGPILERALAPLIAAGYLRIAYGGADVGQYLVYHRGIDDIHITGSDRTHDAIVWGPPGPEQDRRRRANEPVLQIPISSELGNVSPVAIVPYTYTEKELWFQARNVVTMVVNNASFNCNAAKMLITATGWAQRDEFLGLVRRGLSSVPARRAYYPGAFQRFDDLTGGRAALETFGARSDECLPWALVPGLNAADDDERLFRVEPFCGVLSETSIASADPVDFIRSATGFMNERLWGTLNAMFIIHPSLERDAAVASVMEQAVADLRYGTVGINHWPALGYAFCTLPWGGHPSSTLQDIQSGIGWVHNPYMLEGVDKAVIRGNLVVRPDPAWFFDNPRAEAVAPRVAAMEAEPSFSRLPALLFAALR